GPGRDRGGHPPRVGGRRALQPRDDGQRQRVTAAIRPAPGRRARGARPRHLGAEWRRKRDVRGATMPGTETRPIESDADTGEDDGYAHYARKDEITRAAVLGAAITDFRGHRFYASLRP